MRHALASNQTKSEEREKKNYASNNKNNKWAATTVVYCNCFIDLTINPKTESIKYVHTIAIVKHTRSMRSYLFRWEKSEKDSTTIEKKASAIKFCVNSVWVWILDAESTVNLYWDQNENKTLIRSWFTIINRLATMRVLFIIAIQHSEYNKQS